MVDRNKKFNIVNAMSEFEDIQQAIDKSINTESSEKKQKNQQNPHTEVLLFFSFDIVNSTAYKTIDYMGWARVLNNLFKNLRNKVRQKIGTAELWRMLGDEIIFIVKVDDQEVLGQYVDRIFQILVDTIDEIKKGEHFNSTDKNEDRKKLLQSILSLKAAAWIASVTDVGDIDQDTDELDVADSKYENIYECYKVREEHYIFEFMGNDIDAGFRIEKYTQDGRLILSFELAYLLYKLGENNTPRLNIITYKKLKGIWKDKFYPIIWYHDQNAYPDGELKFEDSFSFDAYEENELVREYYDNRDDKCTSRVIRDMSMFNDISYAFEKILYDRRLEEKLKKLQEDIDNQSNRSMLYFGSRGLQMHCAVICFRKNSSEAEILVAKRSESRNILPDLWEFGGAKITTKQSIVEQVKAEYKKDFGIEIEPVLDYSRKNPQPIPLAVYEIKNETQVLKETLVHKGIIILAKITEDSNIDLLPQKHESYQWVKKANYQDMLTEDQCVENFFVTLEVAFEKIEALNL